MLTKMIKIIILVALVVFIGWIGLSVYSCFNRQDIGQTNMPVQDEAAYSVYIENTGNLILTNEYELHGSEVGSRVFILKGFWELSGQEFVYKDIDILLNEAIFGEITIKRRVK